MCSGIPSIFHRTLSPLEVKSTAQAFLHAHKSVAQSACSRLSDLQQNDMSQQSICMPAIFIAATLARSLAGINVTPCCIAL